MANYIAKLSTKAQKQLDKLPDNIANPILNSILDLEINLRPIGNKKLKGRNGYRIRIGNYLVIYDIFDKDLIVDEVAVGHRKDI